MSVLDQAFYVDEIEQERRIVAGLREKLATRQSEIELTRKVLAIRSAPGFTDYVKAIKEVQTRVHRSWIGQFGSDSDLRRLQGKAQALQDILSMLERTENTLQSLVASERELQDALDRALSKIPPSAR